MKLISTSRGRCHHAITVSEVFQNEHMLWRKQTIFQRDVNGSIFNIVWHTFGHTLV